MLALACRTDLSIYTEDGSVNLGRACIAYYIVYTGNCDKFAASDKHMAPYRELV